MAEQTVEQLARERALLDNRTSDAKSPILNGSFAATILHTADGPLIPVVHRANEQGNKLSLPGGLLLDPRQRDSLAVPDMPLDQMAAQAHALLDEDIIQLAEKIGLGTIRLLNPEHRDGLNPHREVQEEIGELCETQEQTKALLAFCEYLDAQLRLVTAGRDDAFYITTGAGFKVNYNGFTANIHDEKHIQFLQTLAAKPYTQEGRKEVAKLDLLTFEEYLAAIEQDRFKYGHEPYTGLIAFQEAFGNTRDVWAEIKAKGLDIKLAASMRLLPEHLEDHFRKAQQEGIDAAALRFEPHQYAAAFEKKEREMTTEQTVKLDILEDVRKALAGQQKIGTIGYSGLGYNNPEQLKRQMREDLLVELLNRFGDPRKTDKILYVVHGGNVDGGINDYTQQVVQGLQNDGYAVEAVGIFSQTAIDKGYQIHSGMKYAVAIEAPEQGSWETGGVNAQLCDTLISYGGGQVSVKEGTHILALGGKLILRDFAPNPEKLAKKILQSLGIEVDIDQKATEVLERQDAEKVEGVRSKLLPLAKLTPGEITLGQINNGRRFKGVYEALTMHGVSPVIAGVRAAASKMSIDNILKRQQERNNRNDYHMA